MNTTTVFSVVFSSYSQLLVSNYLSNLTFQDILSFNLKSNNARHIILAQDWLFNTQIK
jgi:hypothetical protein